MKAGALTLALACASVPVGVALGEHHSAGSRTCRPIRAACVNCHVMNEQYDAWLKSGHRHVATCVECHLPARRHRRSGWRRRTTASGTRRRSRCRTSRSRSRSRRATATSSARTACAATRASSTPSYAGGRPRRAGSTACTVTPAPVTARRLSHELEATWHVDRGDAGGAGCWSCWPARGSAGSRVPAPALLTNIFERKAEARQPFVRLVEVTEDTHGPEVWGQNWPHAVRLVPARPSPPTSTEVRRPRPGASDAGPGRAEARPRAVAPAHLRRLRLRASTTATAAGHAFALFDQEQTRRVTEQQQPGACLQCHASNLALYRFAGKGDVQKGFEAGLAMPYARGRAT